MNASDPDQEPVPAPRSDVRWTFLTNHAHVLVTIARDPQCRMREVASRVGVTERGAQKILADLVADGYVTRTRIGRRNSYQIATGRPFRHPVTDGHEVDELLAVLVPSPAQKLDT